jgi:hypothetical protein
MLDLSAVTGLQPSASELDADTGLVRCPLARKKMITVAVTLTQS